MVPAMGLQRALATAQPAILNRDMGSNQWYIHYSRTEGANLSTIKSALQELRAACKKEDVKCAPLRTSNPLVTRKVLIYLFIPQPRPRLRPNPSQGRGTQRRARRP